MVKAATGTDPVTSAHASGAELGDHPGGLGRRLGVVPELRRAEGPTPVVEQDHPVLLPGDRDRRDARATPAAATAWASPSHHASGSCSLHGGCADRVGGAPGGDQRAGVGVAHLDLGRLGRAVDPHDEGHRVPTGPARCGG